MGDLEPLPQPRMAESAVTLGKAALSAIPVVGSAAAELVGATVAPVVYRRQVEWLNELAERVNELGRRDEHWALNNLTDNESFASAVMTALEAARRTNSDAKHDALRNAVLNSVAPGAPDEQEQAMLIRFVDELMPWHLRVLAVGANPRRWFAMHAGLTPPSFGITSSHSQLLEAAIPELRGRRELYDQLIRDLNARGLAGADSLHVTMTADGAWTPWATPLGQRLIAFITEPTIDSNTPD